LIRDEKAKGTEKKGTRREYIEKGSPQKKTGRLIQKEEGASLMTLGDGLRFKMKAIEESGGC